MEKIMEKADEKEWLILMNEAFKLPQPDVFHALIEQAKTRWVDSPWRDRWDIFDTALLIEKNQYVKEMKDLELNEWLIRLPFKM